jgi:thymidylate synthase
MYTIDATDVNEGLLLGVQALKAHGRECPSRNGPVIEMPEPVSTTFRNPNQRVLFSKLRRANPFFHLFESLWMLAGRDDVKFVAQFAKQMKEYSDDGQRLNGAYGYRWRKWFGRDQLAATLKLLKEDPFSRRAVVAIWDGATDGTYPSKDLPCNLSVVFSLRPGSWASGSRVENGNRLYMTVYNRSNDIIWGLYGANCVHFSVLQEYMAGALGVSLGTYTHVSNSFHAYTENPQWEKLRDRLGYEDVDIYRANYIPTFPLMTEDQPTWDRDLLLFLEAPGSVGMKDRFFHKVAKPMWYAHRAVKEGDRWKALQILDQMPLCDWKLAARQWILGTKKAREIINE